ncbi:hypothetical protein IWW36_004440, partial [Coemansia brasiliensis]
MEATATGQQLKERIEEELESIAPGAGNWVKTITYNNDGCEQDILELNSLNDGSLESKDKFNAYVTFMEDSPFRSV